MNSVFLNTGKEFATLEHLINDLRSTIIKFIKENFGRSWCYFPDRLEIQSSQNLIDCFEKQFWLPLDQYITKDSVQFMNSEEIDLPQSFLDIIKTLGSTIPNVCSNPSSMQMDSSRIDHVNKNKIMPQNNIRATPPSGNEIDPIRYMLKSLT